MDDRLRCAFCGGDPFEPNHETRCDGRQGGLEFDPLEAFEVNPYHNVRRTDPDTSHEAALERAAEKRRDRDRVLAAIRAAQADGLTDYELADRVDRQQNSAGKRRGELRDAGLVRDSGRRRAAPSGSRAIVWVAVEDRR